MQRRAAPFRTSTVELKIGQQDLFMLGLPWSLQRTVLSEEIALQCCIGRPQVLHKALHAW